ncbi:MAG TPA: GtrA family protein [Myxococcaceae bacterium]|nr:GtrA family protein [Myxococcaceae bacterium]
MASEVSSAGGRRSARLRELWHFLASQVSASVASAVDVVVMEGLIFLGCPYGWAILAGHLAGGASDFSAKRHLIFRTGGERLTSQAARYGLTWVTSLGLNLLLARLLVDVLHLAAPLGVLVAAVAVGLAWNYPMHRLYVFRTPRPG